MGSHYKHLCMEERALIQTQLSMGWRPAAVAAGLQRSRSTVVRELRRNGWRSSLEVSYQSRCWGNGGYLARLADRRARRLRSVPRVVRKLVAGTPLWDQVMAE